MAKDENCIAVAADLIKTYRINKQIISGTLFWHEGQLRALIGSNKEAIELFERSLEPESNMGWNEYVRATIAFLANDIKELQKQRELLISIPKPDVDFTDANGNKIDIPWPPNIEIVDGFIGCMGKPYSEAYSKCREN